MGTMEFNFKKGDRCVINKNVSYGYNYRFPDDKHMYYSRFAHPTFCKINNVKNLNENFIAIEFGLLSDSNIIDKNIIIVYDNRVIQLPDAVIMDNDLIVKKMLKYCDIKDDIIPVSLEYYEIVQKIFVAQAKYENELSFLRNELDECGVKTIFDYKENCAYKKSVDLYINDNKCDKKFYNNKLSKLQILKNLWKRISK